MRYAYILAFVAAQGCVANDQSLTIDRFIPPDVSTGTTTTTTQAVCSISATNMFSVSQGILDVGLVQSISISHGYEAFAVVSNNLPDRTTATDVQRDAIYLVGTDVELTLTGSLAGALPASQQKFSTISAGQRLNPGMMGMGDQVALAVEVIPRQIAEQLAAVVPAGGDPGQQIVIAHVKPVGTKSGSQVVGAAVDFPIEICKFCLSPPIAACPAGGFPPTTTILPGNPCNVAQDDPVTCCSSGSAILCGAAVPRATM
jgi:hypothetical protein